MHFAGGGYYLVSSLFVELCLKVMSDTRHEDKSAKEYATTLS